MIGIRERAMLEIRERCAWDMKELCTDKTLRTSKTLEDIFKLNYQQTKKYDKSEFMKIT